MAAIVFGGLTLLTAAAAKPPNFILMMSDDTGWGDMGYNGGAASTPHLDAWSAAPGAIRFDRFYAGSPICSPTRASFLTGRTPWRDCIYNVDVVPLSKTEAAHFTVASAAKSKGYRTAHFGKVGEAIFKKPYSSSRM
jgi:arylsulfatase A-like enzyme